jgi:hypothetical protein
LSNAFLLVPKIRAVAAPAVDELRGDLGLRVLDEEIGCTAISKADDDIGSHLGPTY